MVNGEKVVERLDLFRAHPLGPSISTKSMPEALLSILMLKAMKYRWFVFLGLLICVSCTKDNRTELFELNHFVDFEIQPGLNTLIHIFLW